MLLLRVVCRGGGGKGNIVLVACGGGLVRRWRMSAAVAVAMVLFFLLCVVRWVCVFICACVSSLALTLAHLRVEQIQQISACCGLCNGQVWLVLIE